MNRIYLQKCVLTALLFVVLTGSFACSAPSSSISPSDGLPPGTSQAGSEAPEAGGQPNLPAGGEISVDIDCTDTHPHPIGQSIAETYEVPYEQVMTWFCSGYSFENILLALETSEATDIPVDTLLEMLLEKDWEEIWDDIDLVDKP